MAAPQHNQFRLIWFQHFHKAGGTSLINLAAANGETFSRYHCNGNPTDRDGKLLRLWEFDAQELTRYIDDCQSRGTTFVATEWGMPSVEWLAADPRVQLVTVVRHPVARLLSNFYYDFYNGYTDVRCLRDYRDQLFMQHTASNYYLTMLTGQWHIAPGQEQSLLQRALVALDQFQHCVVIERPTPFAELCQRLGWSVSDAHANQTRCSSRSQQLRKALRMTRKGRLDLAYRQLFKRQDPEESVFRSEFEQRCYYDHQIYQHALNRQVAPAS